MFTKPHRNHALDNLRDKTQVGYRSIRVQVVRIKWWFFFNLGRTNARFWLFGSIPSLIDALHNLAIDGAICLQNCITSPVGAGSRPLYLAGKFMMILEISAVVTGRNVDSVPADRGSTTAGGAGCVDWRILSTLPRNALRNRQTCVWWRLR